METQKVVVVLLVVAILMSAISIIMNLSIAGSLGDFRVPVVERNIITSTEGGNGASGVELSILPPGSAP